MVEGLSPPPSPAPTSLPEVSGPPTSQAESSPHLTSPRAPWAPAISQGAPSLVHTSEPVLWARLISPAPSSPGLMSLPGL